MAGTLTIGTLSDGTNSTSATNCIQGSAKAWVNFNGTGTVAIRGSYNVSSITDNGTGQYQVNFTTAMPDANYSAVATADRTQGSRQCVATVGNGTGAITTTSVGIQTLNDGTTLADAAYVGVSLFR